MTGALSRDRLAILAGLAAPLALAAVLIPFRASIPNTDAALALLLVVVAVAANGYRLQGRFLMAPGPETQSTLDQRLIAVAFADQVGAALASSQPAHRQL